MDLVNTQLVATQQQLQQLQERYNELSMHHGMLLQEVIGLQKTVMNHEHVIQDVMSFLHAVDAQRRRDSRVLNNSFVQGTNGQNGNADHADPQLPFESHDEPASPLQHASKLLNEVNADEILHPKNLEHMNEVAVRLNGNNTTPPLSEAAFRAGGRPHSREPPGSATSSNMRFGDLDNLVYPVGQTNGIDPTYGEHAHNIPYPLPTKPLEPTDPRYQPRSGKTHSMDPGWIRQPQILLVEDDSTCRRIGGRFLYAFNCSIDSAVGRTNTC